MNISYSCPKCEEFVRVEFDDETAELQCPACQHSVVVARDAVGDGHVIRCLVCPSDELYVRKNFPQRLGLTIVVIGFMASCIPWYYRNWWGTFAILSATALLDLLLFFLMGSLLQCYRCHAQYRGVAGLENRDAFNLEIHEKYRQQTARLTDHEAAATTKQPAGAAPTSRSDE